MESPAPTPHVDRRNPPGGSGVCKYPGAGCLDEALVAADMVAVLMGIQDLADLEPAVPGDGEASPEIEWINGQCLTGFVTGDEVVEVSQAVGSPDLFDDQLGPRSTRMAIPTGNMP